MTLKKHRQHHKSFLKFAPRLNSLGSLFVIGSVTYSLFFVALITLHGIPLPSNSIRSLNVEPVYKDIVGHVHNWITPATRATKAKGHQILMVVSHRELLFGCRSFEEYLSPLFHTLFILPEDIARELRVDQLVQKATFATSAGAHLFYSDGYAGNSMAIDVGEQFAAYLDASILDDPLDYLVVAMCDVHQLPQNHILFQSTESMILRMAKDFETSKAYRFRGEFLESNYNEDGNTPLSSVDLQLQMPKSQMGILAMNTILWEEVPDLETVKIFHGSDVGNWFKNQQHKPQSLIDRDLPWLWDISQFMEGHLLMFDLHQLRMLRQLAPGFITGRKNNAEEQEVFPAVANHFNMTIIRNNDLAFHLDINTENQDPSRINLEWIKAKTFELMGIVLSPRFDFFASVTGYKETGVTTASMVIPWKSSICLNFKEGWLPHNSVAGIPITDEGMKMIVQGILGYFGYIPVVAGHEDDHHLSRNSTTTLRYELDGGFPGSRVLRLSPGVADNDDKWTRLLTMRHQKNGHQWTLYMCNYYNPECSRTRQLAFSRRLLEIPMSNEISMETIHIGEGRVDKNDPTMACYDRYSPFWKTIQNNPDLDIPSSERRKLIEELLLSEQVEQSSRAYPIWIERRRAIDSNARPYDWCVSEDITNKTDKIPKGLLFVKVHKCSSSTGAGVTLRIQDGLSKRLHHPNQNQTNNITCFAHYRHATARELRFQERDPTQSFLWSFVREPAQRTLSHFFYFYVSQMNVTDTEDSIVSILNFPTHKMPWHPQYNYQSKYLDLPPSQDEQSSSSIDRIINGYDFLGVVERMEESLVVLAMLAQIPLTDVVVYSSKVSGGYSYNKDKEGCVKVKKKWTTPKIEEHIRGEYRKANKDDYLLYNTALRSLDKTIDALGRKRVEENVKLLRSLHRRNEEKCVEKITMPCPKPEGIQWEEQKRRASESCYEDDFGCGHACTDLVLADQAEKEWSRITTSYVYGQG